MRSTFRMFCLLLISSLLGLLAVSCSSPTPVDPDYKFKEGEVTRYKYQTSQKGTVTIDGDVEEFDLQMVNTISQKVQKVDENGVATIDTGYEDVSLTVDGESFPLQEFANTSLTYEINDDGVIQNVRGTHGLAGPLGQRQFDPSQIFQFQGPMFRDGTLNKGDTWQQTVVLPFPEVGEVQATIDYTYEGKERLKGNNNNQNEAAKISFVFHTPIDVTYTEMDEQINVTGQEQMEGTAFFSLAQGKTVKSTGKGPLTLSLKMPSEGGGEEIERVKVDIDVDFDYELLD